MTRFTIVTTWNGGYEVIKWTDSGSSPMGERRTLWGAKRLLKSLAAHYRRYEAHHPIEVHREEI